MIDSLTLRERRRKRKEREKFGIGASGQARVARDVVEVEAQAEPGEETPARSSVQRARPATADGATYVWHRNNGRLSGLVKPTSSFKNVEGTICRHVVVMMTTGDKTRKAEGVACRDALGVWSLEG